MEDGKYREERVVRKPSIKFLIVLPIMIPVIFLAGYLGGLIDKALFEAGLEKRVAEALAQGYSAVPVVGHPAPVVAVVLPLVLVAGVLIYVIVCLVIYICKNKKYTDSVEYYTKNNIPFRVEKNRFL